MHPRLTRMVCLLATVGGVGSAQAEIEYHFVPGMNGQPVGYAQGAQIAPDVGPANFLVTISGAKVGDTPGNSPRQAHAYLDKWGLGALNPDAGSDRGITGQVEIDGKNGGEFIRMEFQTAVRLTYLTFASVGTGDNIRLEADGMQVDLGALFPNSNSISEISLAQNLWPGDIDLTQASEPVPFARVWDVFVTAGNGVQLENVGAEVPEPATAFLWLAGLAAFGITVLRRRKSKSQG